VLVLLHLMSSVQEAVEVVHHTVEEVESANLIPRLMDADSISLMKIMIAIMLMLRIMLDFLNFNPLEEELEANALPVISTQENLPEVEQTSVSNIVAQDQEAVQYSLCKLEVIPLNAQRKVKRPLMAITDLSIALILLLFVLPSERNTVQETVWEEEAV